MSDFEPTELTDRLRALGSEPVDAHTQGVHLSMMATAAAPAAKRGSAWAKLAAAFSAGVLLGGTGLASAGMLPDGAQDVAHTTLAKVGVEVPVGTARYNDPAVCGTDEDGKPWKNHGQYVKAHKGDPDASKSDCGKPLSSLGDDEDETTTSTTVPDETTSTTVDDTTSTTVAGSTEDGPGCSEFGHARKDAENGKATAAAAKDKDCGGDDDGTTTSTTVAGDDTDGDVEDDDATAGSGKSDDRRQDTDRRQDGGKGSGGNAGKGGADNGKGKGGSKG